MNADIFNYTKVKETYSSYYRDVFVYIWVELGLRTLVTRPVFPMTSTLSMEQIQ